ncbi:MAG: DUF5716 family protein [Clostridium sp.]|nr:DUF5716 family protein [Acetatifactor muris]MCM1527079.1 DUF5716 family protein [Bacteroides sp.]MCM1562055.1 DUF5716 family protein [Clostridium sp.]
MGLLRHGKLIVGYDLGERFSQISYRLGEDAVETLSSVAGEECYNIPTVLCKRTGLNQWLYGKEALRCAEEGGGILVEHVLGLALAGEQVRIDGEIFDPVALLALFMKRSLGILAQVSSPDKLSAMMITCEKTDARMIEVLNLAVSSMHLKTNKVFYQSHAESFYHYVIGQPEELWRNQSLLLEYSGSAVISHRMECNRRTTPVVCFIDSGVYDMPAYEPMPEEEELQKDKAERLDREFAGIASAACRGAAISSVYLVGEHYSDTWMKESLRLLCMGRRVFQGNNLYSKGACYAMAERLSPSEVGQAHVFLGEDKLKANVGIRILNRGEESYFALLDAGINWYEASQEFEFYMRGGNELDLEITSLIGGESRTVRITLEDMLPGMSRMRARLFLEGEKALVAEIEDLGFGSFRTATGQVWRKQIAL